MNPDTSSQTDNSSSSPLETQVIGSVKWFNNRYGYGFIVATGQHSTYGDVFVHHSELQLSDSNIYKFLMPGEYVQFNITKTLNGKHEFQATKVTGVNGGKLLCENQPLNPRRPSRRAVEESQLESKSTQVLPQESRRPRRPRQEPNANSTTQDQSDGFVFPRGRKPTRPQAPYKNAVTKNSK